jgi:sulfite reductase alpha subunit-like flavoprotein
MGFATELGKEGEDKGYETKVIDLAECKNLVRAYIFFSFSSSSSSLFFLHSRSLLCVCACGQLQDSLKDDPLLIFVTACYGQGEPTDNAREFYEWLMKAKPSTEGTLASHFAVSVQCNVCKLMCVVLHSLFFYFFAGIWTWKEGNVPAKLPSCWQKHRKEIA